MKQQQYDSASKAFKRAVALKPNYGEAYFNLAIVLEQEGFVEDAAKTFIRCALVSSNLAPDAYNSLAIMHRRNGNLTEALTAHQQAISLRDTSSILHVSRINSCFEAEKCELAEAFISEALQRFPNNPQMLYTCARCLLRIGRADQASMLIARLEKLDPKLAEQLKTLMRL
jgi:Flp pilus assembly protein TadD